MRARAWWGDGCARGDMEALVRKEGLGNRGDGGRDSPGSPKNEYPPQPKPSAEVPPPRVYQPVREVPELPDVPDLHRRPPFGSAQ